MEIHDQFCSDRKIFFFLLGRDGIIDKGISTNTLNVHKITQTGIGIKQRQRIICLQRIKLLKTRDGVIGISAGNLNLSIKI